MTILPVLHLVDRAILPNMHVQPAQPINMSGTSKQALSSHVKSTMITHLSGL